MMTPKVSVIIPVFNTESTLSKCLDSFMAQTMSGWELILVDDGSPDDSGRLCEEYKEKCAFLSNGRGEIRVIHRNNGGVSAARQTGLEAVGGEYVIHADPDDWVDPTMLEDLYEKAKAEDADMVICDFFCDVGDKTIYRSQRPTSLLHNDVINDLLSQNIHGSTCNKLVKREHITRCNAIFPFGINYCEDVCFNLQLLIDGIRITYLPKAYYHYVQLVSSITNNYTRYTLENQKCYIDFLETILPPNFMGLHNSKLLVKKLAYRNSVLSHNEFRELYPEIMESGEHRLLLKWMYDSAFKGRFVLADTLLYLYKAIQK